MKKTNTQKGSIAPLIIMVAVLLIAGGIYIAMKNRAPQNNVPVAQQSIATTTEAQPVITSISPLSGPIGTIIELKGTGLAGFEAELDAWIENSKGEKGYLPGTMSIPGNPSIIRVKLDSKLCKMSTAGTGACINESYLTITPGVYKVYTQPWGKMSNKVEFTVTGVGSTLNLKTYINAKYGFSFEYPSGFTLSPYNNDTNISIVDLSGNQVFSVSVTRTIYKDINRIISDVSSSSQIMVGNKSAVSYFSRCVEKRFCTQTIQVPDFTIKSVEQGVTYYRLYVLGLNRTSNEMDENTTKILSTFKFIN